MGGPTWPPTPEEAEAATIEEYGDLARRVIAGVESDEEAELALLAHFLFAPPQRELGELSGTGTPLQEERGHLVPWLRMVTGLDFQLSIAVPAGTDGTDLYLPSAVPGPVEPKLDAALFRTMGVIQLGLVRFGLLKQRGFLAELHGDWVLRSIWTLLASRYVMARWSAEWPGIARDFASVRESSKASALRVGHQTVPSQGLPSAFLPLYQGLVPGSASEWDPGDPAHQATQMVDRIQTEAAAPLVLMGQAQSLRETFRSLRVGPPPLPLYLGLLRPAWMLDDLPAQMEAASEWRKGNKPLRPLIAAMKRRGRGTEVASKLKQRLTGSTAVAPDWVEELRPPRTASDEGHTYEEWDDHAARYRTEATRVLRVDGPTGPIDAYHQIASSLAPEIAIIRREFAALQVEERWHHAQPDGSDLDLSRVVAAMADLQAGHTPRVDWYRRFEHRQRPVCILTMVDVSGSTQGATIHAERAAMVLFSEGLKTLDLPHAFFGFSGAGPRACHWQRIKDWDDPHDEDVHKRIAHLQPGGATRLGAFIRHATATLEARPEARRVLILISDGRPEDGDAYRGRTGIRDTALAVRTAQRAGVHTFCVSLDAREGADGYLTEIFGRGHYLVLERPEALPLRLPEVFRALMR